MKPWARSKTIPIDSNRKHLRVHKVARSTFSQGRSLDTVGMDNGYTRRTALFTSLNYWIIHNCKATPLSNAFR